ncbi:histidinol dehydrogenase [Metallosphaera tengchongensis]|uniref:Histidinol dehydrogenase n=1 Tax=Metallosphaera tengchongensis TaxID=1532350 RepID=A0A6N0NVZ6_9CREN|nr:histidinol dehydrogenase [Metallosphaera tengchongensis]QKQ99537.1 histidinol dehydrogenase [Metallosphaera tengchongensis]
MIRRELPKRRVQSFSDVLDRVREIINRVRVGGDQALRELTLQIDGVKLDRLVLEDSYIKERSEVLDPKVKEAIDNVWLQLTSFHDLIKPPNLGGGSEGVEYGIIWKPIRKLGIYVPGGKKAYPSSLMMAGIPAKIAGVKEIFVSTPTRGDLDPAIAYIAQKLQVKNVYPIGGAQAIAAMAYGTESVKAVDKIVGPGNVYVQGAKFLVSSDVGIDAIEGPTELVIIADENANPKNVALDLMAQGEHGSSSMLVLISNSAELLNEVSNLLQGDNEFYLVKVSSLEEGIQIANELAPEHLSLYTSRARELLARVENAGAITLGNTPPALIDYSAGPDHILPTNGWARFKGGLTVFDFLKGISYVRAERISESLVKSAEIIARYEGFNVHANSVGVRYE